MIDRYKPNSTNGALIAKLLNRSVFEEYENGIRKIILTENDFNNAITEMILESMSIAEEVVSVTSQIRRIIQRKISSNQLSNGCGFRISAFGDYFNVIWNIYDFDSNETNIQPGASVDFDRKVITVGLIKINGEIDYNYLSDSLQHEIEHIYQREKRGDDSNFNDKDKQLYQNALKLLQDENQRGLAYNLGRAIYLTFHAEQDAYVNGLYSVLQNNQANEDLGDLLKQSDAYRQLKFLRGFYRRICLNKFTDKENLTSLLDFLGKNEYWLQTAFEKAIDRFFQ